MRRLAEEVGGLLVVGEADNGREALSQTVALKPDIVLMDIRMPGMDGLEAARHLGHIDVPPAVIFVTAYGDQALAAFEARAVDYLLKPVRIDRLREAIERARKLVGVVSTVVSNGDARTHLCARLRGGLKLLAVADVLYFHADSKYVEAQTRDDAILLEDSLVALEEEFSPRFVRIHRNCIVAIDAISGLRKRADGEVVITLHHHNAELEVSRRNLPQIRKLIRSGLDLD